MGEMTVPPGSVLLGVADEAGAPARWNGLELQPSDLAMAQGYVAVYTTGPATCFTMTLDLTQLRRRYPRGAAMLQRLQEPAGLPTLWRNAAQVHSLRRSIEELLRGRHDADQVDDLLDGRFFPLLASAVGAKTNRIKPSHSQSRRIKAVLECQEYMFGRRGETVTLLDLSEVSGLRPRSLINAFQAVTSLSPMAFLRALRLSRVREALLNAPTQSRVIDVATEWGFWHMGHFTAAYRSMFAETPSQTLRGASPDVLARAVS